MIEEKRLFLTTIPGLESVAHLELCDKWRRASDFFSLPDIPEVEFFKGGIEFSAPITLGLELQKQLRIPNRILLRLANFKAPNQKTFLEEMAKINWSDYFSKNAKYDFRFKSSGSRLSMEKQIKELLSKTLRTNGLQYKKGAPKIFIRILEDECNISLDCAGELAFKRGQGKEGSIASLRESTASGLLRMLLQGVQGPFELIDPMCGAGTFLLEAMQINQGMKRKFAFEQFPVWQNRETPHFVMPPGNFPRPKRVIGLDINEKVVAISQKNLKYLKSEVCHISQADLFAEAFQNPFPDALKRIVVLNPPWGKRLPGSAGDPLKQVIEKFQPDRVGYLIPSHWKIGPQNLEKVRDVPIVNSGVENRFLIFANDRI